MSAGWTSSKVSRIMVPSDVQWKTEASQRRTQPTLTGFEDGDRGLCVRECRLSVPGKVKKWFLL